MEEVFINTIQDFNDYQGVETLHPLVSVVHVENTEHIRECVMHYGVYAIYLKENKGCKLSYGRTPYDFDEMTVTSFAPGQVLMLNQIPMCLLPSSRPWCSIPTFSTAPRWESR